ncbi:hypothetical protein BOX15_Mlig009914g1 [Macrostomum lignano]|uniref:Cyclin N-terminal domain-containing protein n=2 Tax=Macrostomum lignano TaxID=282301 RepID=A0A1I8H735_9PLAT|nr:hypothetical protein BOX15_Mlig009914g1 [Macrostomum lignano]
MAESLPELTEQLKSSLELHYSPEIATKAVELYKRSGEEYKVYIVGCLILTLTASVKPEYTLLSRRKSNLLQSQLYSIEQASELAESGLYLDDQPRPQQQHRLVCFHCSAKIPHQSGSLSAHRQASPGCYFVRFFDFIKSMGSADPSFTESVIRDIGRYVKALRKLKTDLCSQGMAIAMTYGFDNKLLTFCTARHFMRNSGRVPDRAGDLIQLVHSIQPLFHESVPLTVDILALLEPLKLLPGRPESSGYHSVVVGQYDRLSGSMQSRVHSLTHAQLQAIQSVLTSNPSASGAPPGQS